MAIAVAAVKPTQRRNEKMVSYNHKTYQVNRQTIGSRLGGRKTSFVKTQHKMSTCKTFV
jgi:hypothetical protein